MAITRSATTSGRPPLREASSSLRSLSIVASPAGCARLGCPRGLPPRSAFEKQRSGIEASVCLCVTHSVPSFAPPQLFAVLAAATRGRQASRHRRRLRDPTSARGEPRRPQPLRHRLTAHTRALQPRTQISDNLRHARSAGCNHDKRGPSNIATTGHSRKPALCGRPLRRNRKSAKRSKRLVRANMHAKRERYRGRRQLAAGRVRPHQLEGEDAMLRAGADGHRLPLAGRK